MGWKGEVCRMKGEVYGDGKKKERQEEEGKEMRGAGRKGYVRLNNIALTREILPTRSYILHPIRGKYPG